jgi:hypothetical protein
MLNLNNSHDINFYIMAISKQFQPHTELKAEDLNELIAQINDFILTEGAKKPDKVDISQYHSEGSELPLAVHYTYNGLPTEAFSGHCIETDDDYIAICNYHWDSYYSIFLYVKNEQNKFIFSSQFHNNEAQTVLEKFVADMVAGTPATHTHNGVMTKEDKAMFDDMVAEVFPLTVGVVSSNAGTYEIGTSITPQIVLSITRKGADVPAADITENISPTPVYISPDKRTISGNQVSSGTTTYQIAVTQGGQTKNAPSQVFDFMNYMYFGETSTKPANANAVATLCENGSLGKQLSRATTKASTNLAANRYYVFAVKGSVNLVCRHAGTDAVVTGCTTGTATIQRVNNSGSDSYSYIIVEKSNSAWSFKITNS